MRRDGILHVALAALAGTAAGQKPPAPPAAPAVRVAVAPLTSLTEGSGRIAPIEAVVVDGLKGVRGVALVPMAELRQALKKARRPELEACDGEAPCLTEVGKLVGAQRVVSGEVGAIGEDQVVYLKVVDVAAARETGSTTAVLSKAEGARRTEARAAAVRLLSPREYLGTLELQVDVTGAIIYLDGRKVATSPARPITAAVGTHALRVTHEQYRDYVRFVDVKFGETSKLPVGMTAFPVISDEMRGERTRQPKGPVLPLPWYRRWYTVVGFGAALLVGAAVVTFATAERLDKDATITIDDRP
jgi:hypothetical protein